MSLILPKESNIILCIGAAELLSSQIRGGNELGYAGGDALANPARDEHPDLPGVGAIAQSMMVGLLRKRVKEIGHGETVDETATRIPFVMSSRQIARLDSMFP